VDGDDEKSDDITPIKIKELYTVRDVIKQEYSEEILAEIGYKPNEEKFIGNYQRAVTTVYENMSSSELKKAEEIADNWNKLKAPPHVQLKYVLKSFTLCCYKYRIYSLGWPRKSSQKISERRLMSGSL
jgi:hypothetical protein